MVKERISQLILSIQVHFLTFNNCVNQSDLTVYFVHGSKIILSNKSET